MKSVKKKKWKINIVEMCREEKKLQETWNDIFWSIGIKGCQVKSEGELLLLWVKLQLENAYFASNFVIDIFSKSSKKIEAVLKTFALLDWGKPVMKKKQEHLSKEMWQSV